MADITSPQNATRALTQSQTVPLPLTPTPQPTVLSLPFLFSNYILPISTSKLPTMGKKTDSYQPPMRFRVRPRPSPTYGTPTSGFSWRNFFSRLPAFIALILTSVVVVSSYSEQGARVNLEAAHSIVQDASGQPMFRVRIRGYWKEVRESLGLEPLQDTFLWPYSLSRATGETSTRVHVLNSGLLKGQECAGHPSESTGLLSNDANADDDSERRLLRLGRFNPHLRRWGSRRSMMKFPLSYASIMDCLQLGSKEAHSGAHPGSESASSSSISAGADTEGGQDVKEKEQNYLQLFISKDVDASHQETPMLDVESLAASFRAVAAHELRARSGLSHGDGRMERMFRHLMG